MSRGQEVVAGAATDTSTTTETVVTSPLVPGLELVIPAGSTITDEDDV